MGDLDVRTTPYASVADMRRHFERLAEANAPSVCVRHPIGDALLGALLDEARRREIHVRELRVRSGALSAVRDALAERFERHDPSFLRWQPLERLILDIPVEGPSDHVELEAALRQHRAALLDLNSGFRVALEARLSLTHVDGAGLASTCEHLVAHQMSKVELVFEPSALRAEGASSLRRELATFCEQRVATNAALRVSGLPFCFLPGPHFRLLYRGVDDLVPIQGDIFAQRDLIKGVKRERHRYHAPCRSCRRKAACYAMTPIKGRPDVGPHVVAAQEDTLVFAGGSLTKEDIREHQRDDILFTTPAEQGDAFVAILEGFSTILLLDGYFYDKYSLTTFEVLLALLEDVHVFGAASIGALRALELEHWGMRGSGYVLDFLRKREIAPYHVVAQTYDQDNRARTEPLVAVLRFLELAEREGILDAMTQRRSAAIAESIHFTDLTFPTLFIELERASDVGAPAVAALRAFLAERGKSAFDVKRHDALALLRSFRARRRRDGAGYSARTAKAARSKYLRRLRAKYLDSHDSTLPRDWRGSGSVSVAGRERPASETIALAKRFFSDLDVVVTDTSRFDQTAYTMINVVFIPFFFLEYGLSTGSGYGQTQEEALVSAYGEVFERIPAGTLRRRHVDRGRARAKSFPFLQLPYYRTLSPSRLQRQVDGRGRLRDRRCVLATDILHGREVALPVDGVRLPSTCGMAAGNSLREALTYALLEVVEHDVYAVYESFELMRALRHLVIAPSRIRDESVQRLLAQLEERGHEVTFYALVNPYDIPVVFCTLYEADRRWVFCGVSCRIDLEAAMVQAFQEALNGHYVSYIGSRDDKQAVRHVVASEPRCHLDVIAGEPRTSAPPTPLLPIDPADALGGLLDRLRAAGVEHVFAVDLSPKEHWRLKAVKVIVPGLDLRRRRGGGASASFHAKCVATQALVASFGGAPPPNARRSSPRALERAYALPFRRFVIA